MGRSSTGLSTKASLRRPAASTRNLDGQRLGRKGAETRERLIAAVATLIESTPVRELRITDITRQAAAAPSSFYRYFETVDDVLLAAIADRAPMAPALIDLVRLPWPLGSIRARSTDFAAAFLLYWEEHFALLHVRNLAADEGDHRFMKLRWSAISPLFSELAGKVAQGQRDGRIATDVDPAALAGALMSSLERMAAGARQEARTRTDFPREALAVAAGYLIATALGEPSSPRWRARTGSDLER
jgi:AcrR family transcriptional regulator